MKDALVALVLTVATQLELVLAGDRVSSPLLAQHVAFGAMTGSVALRRTAPLTAALLVAVGMVVQTLAGEAPVAGGFLAMLIVVASLGYHAPWRRGIAGLVAVAMSALVYDLLAERFVLGDFVANAAIVVGAWGLAHAVRRSTDARVAGELATDRATRDAVVSERQRIARDLHDSVAHAVTLMTLQAGNARERTADPVLQDALRSVESGGRAALEDMHRFLRVLGTDGTAETLGLRDLDDMIDAVRAGGLGVEVVLDGDLEHLPPSVSATAFRVAQEALTNTMKHSDAARATLAVHNDGRKLRIDVLDDASTGATSRKGPAPTVVWPVSVSGWLCSMAPSTRGAR